MNIKESVEIVLAILIVENIIPEDKVYKYEQKLSELFGFRPVNDFSMSEIVEKLKEVE